ncbi:MAG: ATPase [Chroococcidiopsidaceae cyanobacterium CP_BM_ER_R8_30]|nr:ATPase [Chroococcidiopsidaceae cyanobacterium CP_BM_ER_R8_30]
MTVARTICLGFLAVIIAGTILLMMPFSTNSSTWNDPIVALFTATSAVCVTGLSVVNIGTYFSFWGQFLIVVLFQIGGLGYMTATTFLLLLLGRKFGLRDKIALQQALDKQGMQGGIQLIRSIIATTMIFEITGIFLLLPVFTPEYGFIHGLWLAIFHSVSAWTNASFSLFQNSFINYRSSVLLNLTITGLIIFGGIGYEVILESYLRLRERLLLKRRKVIFSLNFKVVTSTTLILLILGTLAFLFAEWRNPETFGSLNLENKLMAAWFLSVSTRTAGFDTINIGQLSPDALFIATVLMFIGAAPGSTAGGIKITTLRVLTSCTKASLQGKEEVLLYQRRVPISLILKAIGVVVGSLTTVMISTTLISITDPKLNFLDTLFEVMSAFATVGLSTGITASISAPAKLILVATMYIGRVGVLLLMSALLGDPHPSIVRYPEENLLVG